jgi:flagellar basal body-associated protein FliL
MLLLVVIFVVAITLSVATFFFKRNSEKETFESQV